MNQSSKNPQNLCGENLDRLSSLPDQLLLHILSFLPTLDAVRSVAIQRFSTLWSQLDCFDFDYSRFCYYKNARDERSLSLSFFQLVNNVLLLHEGSKIQKFKLKIEKILIRAGDQEWLRKLMEAWICQLKAKKVQVFDVSLYTIDRDCYSITFIMPGRIFMSQSLVELCLENCEINKSQTFSLESLQLLRLSNVFLDGGTFKKLLHGCPMLRDLTIANCEQLHDIMFTASNIEKLEVIKTDEFYGSQVLIDCPNLKSFLFVGFAKLVAVVNLPKIQYACIKFEDDIGNVRFSSFSQLLHGVKHARSLTISDSRILMNSNFAQKPNDFGGILSVRKLTLDNVSLSNKLLKEIALACTSLQDLSIINCSGLEEISLSIPTLEKLTLSCPEAIRIEFSGRAISLHAINIPSTVNFVADLQFQNCDARERIAFWKFLRSIRNVKVLTLSENSVKALTYFMGIGNPCPTNYWKHVILNTSLSQRHVSMLCSLLRKSLRLEELTVNVIGQSECHTEVLSSGAGEIMLPLDFPYRQIRNYTCLKAHLRRVTINGHRSMHLFQIQITDIIVKNASLLEKFTLCCED